MTVTESVWDHLCPSCGVIFQCPEPDCADVVSMPCGACLAVVRDDPVATEQLVQEAVHLSLAPSVVDAFRLHRQCKRPVEQ